MFEVKNIEVVHYIQHNGNFYRRRYIEIDDAVVWAKKTKIKKDNIGDVTRWVDVLNPTELESKFQDTKHADN